MIEFGDIYFIPKQFSEGITGHWVVILGVDNKTIFYEYLQSGIFKIFPEFGSMLNNTCFGCSSLNLIIDKRDLLRKYKNGLAGYIGVDSVIFLNYIKYSGFLNRSTFISLENIQKENTFIFEDRVKRGIYKREPDLLRHNAQMACIVLRQSEKITDIEKNIVLNSYKTSLKYQTA